MSRTEARPPIAFRLLIAPLTLLERSKGRRRLAIAAAYQIVLLALGLLAWRASRLNSLPDVGDPFDPGPILRLRVPDDRNAFTLYHQAALKVKKAPDVERRICNTPYAWPANDPPGLAYISANAAADDLFRRGSERPDALVLAINDLMLATELGDLQEMRGFARRALIRASGCRDRGDLAGAWAWYRAILRAGRHSSRHSLVIGRLVGAAVYSAGRAGIAGWTVDDRVDAAMLRRALADVRDAEALRTPDSEAVRIEYLSMMASLRDPEWVRQARADGRWSQGEQDPTDWRSHLPMLQEARLFLGNEPERSRRLMKLAFANWLGHVDDPPSSRPTMVGVAKSPRIVFDVPSRPLSPSALAEAFESSLLAKSYSVETLALLLRVMDRDRAIHASLVLELARQLHAREHDGLLPDSDLDLVGPYLDRWPDGLAPPPADLKGPPK